MKRQLAMISVCAALGACAGTTPTATHVRLPDAPPAGEPSGTTGLSEASLKSLYGQPAFVRHDGTAQIWRFDGAACKAFFFLYSKEGVTAVWHVETTPRGVSIAADETCLSALRARIASRPVS
ncbi:MAG TPA: hypothetical protein VNU97_19690 [Rhizomicrobium sp.]|jgi:hypothetical protein|nr:hypothetical protein [Rhizomicrobium sp.]